MPVPTPLQLHFKTPLDRRLYGMRRRGASVEALLAYHACANADTNLTPEVCAFVVQLASEGALVDMGPMEALDHVRDILGLPSIIEEYAGGTDGTET